MGCLFLLQALENKCEKLKSAVKRAKQRAVRAVTHRRKSKLTICNAKKTSATATTSTNSKLHTRQTGSSHDLETILILFNVSAQFLNGVFTMDCRNLLILTFFVVFIFTAFATAFYCSVLVLVGALLSIFALLLVLRFLKRL